MKGEEIRNVDSISLKAYYKDIRKLEILDGDTQTELAIRAKEGDKDAEEKLVKSNLRFVLSIANDYTYTGVPLEDLISEGNIGLIKAIERFDETKGFKFISYAVWWIRQCILQSAYENGNNVRLPVNRINAINKVSKATEALTKQLNREPTIKEISDYYKNPETGVTDLSEKDIVSAYDDSGMDVSLNSTVAEDSKTELHESIEGEGLAEIEGVINKKSLQHEIDGVLDELTEREARIIKLYFGLGEKDEMTLREIGEELGLTNERVRQIKEFALKKLRTYNNSSKLKEFLSCEIK